MVAKNSSQNHFNLCKRFACGNKGLTLLKRYKVKRKLWKKFVEDENLDTYRDTNETQYFYSCFFIRLHSA